MAQRSIPHLRHGETLFTHGGRNLSRWAERLVPWPFAQQPRADLVLHINRELIHHGAEVALLRDLWAGDHT